MQVNNPPLQNCQAQPFQEIGAGITGKLFPDQCQSRKEHQLHEERFYIFKYAQKGSRDRQRELYGNE